jgi:hypothetical protein
MRFKLTRFALFGAICLAAVPALMAAEIDTCPSVALATTYVNSNGTANSFTCVIGNLQFSNFNFTGLNITASQVEVQSLPTPGNEGLDFTGAFDVGGNNDPSTMDVNVGFTVTALTGTINDLQIDLGPDDIGTAGQGHIHYVENYCSNTGCNIFVDNPGTASLTSEIPLTSPPLTSLPITSLTVDKDLSLHANNGTASVSAFDNRYSNSSVPEPRAISFFLGLALLCGVTVMKRRQAARG